MSPLPWRRRPAPTIKSRVLVLELDSVQQAARFDKAPSVEAAVHELTGIVRTALLLADRITVTDSMLFDGVYFAHMPPDALAQALGVHSSALPIEVVTSHESLAASLAAKRDNPAFDWQLTPRVTDAHAARHWDAWLALEGRVPTTQYRPLPAFSAPDAEWVAALTPAAAALLDSLRGEQRRSVATAAVAEAAQQHPLDRHIARVAAWWSTVYNIAIAQALDADWLRFDAVDDHDDGLEREAARGRRRLSVSPTLVETATDAAAPLFGMIRSNTAPHRRRLRTGASWWRMRALTYAVTQTGQSPKLWRALVDAVMRLAIAGIAIALIVPGFADGLEALGFAWAIFAVSAVATIPYSAIGLLFQTLRREKVPLLSIQVQEDS
ncbi:hypothetical protein ACFQRL_01040 [Microbacterium fluvii]|uniref:Uncharacterized protein n=1 Tax=Microbacterium fluvii TaxID=415215 RepID=A0ABW2H944_9MICO|nr:hypothetical protein [Microbacterium fluvii]MCU4671172.1 hypothetical protein [Microbacterium fluvii]